MWPIIKNMDGPASGSPYLQRRLAQFIYSSTAVPVLFGVELLAASGLSDCVYEYGNNCDFDERTVI
jgi:hypothetical protein